MSGTGFKTSKAELVAIYRLEFYKKQKSWKFCHDTKKEKQMKTTKAKKAALLDKTYIVGDPVPDVVSPFNEAFLESDSDTNTATSPNRALSPDSSSWPNTTRQLSQVAPPNTERTDPTPTLPTPANILADQLKQSLLHGTQTECQPQPEYIWPGVPKFWQDPEASKKFEKSWLNTKVWSKDEQIWPQSPKNWPEPVVWQDNELVWPQETQSEGTETKPDRVTCERGWPVQSEMWTNAGPILPEAVWAEDAGSALGEESAAALVTAAERWLTGQEPNPMGLLDDDGSLDSICEFIRGAHCGPHSSELDLPAPGSAGEGEAEAEAEVARAEGEAEAEAAQLSARALGARLAAHARALRGLLREAAARRALGRGHTGLARTCPSPELYPGPPHCSSYEEFPTRDVGPQIPRGGLLRQNTYDVFLAGSYRNDIRVTIGERGQGTEALGRGRGRLARGVIGIGMGRPYRL